MNATMRPLRPSTSEARLRAIIARVADAAPDSFGPDDDLRATLGLDSLSALRIAAAVEREFAVTIPDEKLHEVSTLRDLLQVTGAPASKNTSRFTSRAGVVVVALAAMLAGSTGCAMVAHSSVQKVVVTSEPLGALVRLNGEPVGVTPLRLELKRRSKSVLRFEKDGFQAREIQLMRDVSGWLLVDVAVSFNPMAMQGLDSTDQWPRVIVTSMAWLLGIDFITGAAYKLPPLVRATLTPIR